MTHAFRLLKEIVMKGKGFDMIKLVTFKNWMATNERMNLKFQE
jgi:hypothetical protein